jgi:hypothetical protein
MLVSFLQQNLPVIEGGRGKRGGEGSRGKN